MNFINYICLCSSIFEARTSSPLHFLSNLKNNIVIVKKKQMHFVTWILFLGCLLVKFIYGVVHTKHHKRVL